MRRFTLKTLERIHEWDDSKPKDKYIRVIGVYGDLVLCGITDQTPLPREGDIGRRCAVSLVVSDNFDMIVLPHTNTSEKKRYQESITRE